MTESDAHKQLKLLGKQMLLERGFLSEDIKYEKYVIANEHRRFKVDVFGVKNGKITVIECGVVSPKDKMDILRSSFEEAIHLPYTKSQNMLVFPLVIENVLWEKFKEKIPRTITLNDAIVELIAREVKKKL